MLSKPQNVRAFIYTIKFFTQTFVVTSLVLASSVLAADWKQNLPQPITDSDYHNNSQEKAKLGQLLFFDPILSGNKNISCSTCHHHNHATTDGLSLPVGEGGVGLGPKRTVGTGKDLIEFRVPRNSQSLFNLGAKEFNVMFNDGRVSIDSEELSGFDSPADEKLPTGLKNVLAVQAMFPVISETEMLGDGEENDLASAFRYNIEDVWPLIAKRIREIPEYVDLFKAAFVEIKDANDITMVDIANAIGEFIASEWRADESPFDSYLQGNENALNELEKQGMALFYGKANCHSCHTGKFQTDHSFHSIAMPQVGLIRTRQFDPVVRDMGRVNQSNLISDSYKFRTPSLRNISHTKPYGHSGAYATLEAIIRHHLDPVSAFKNYDQSQVILPHHPLLSSRDFIVMANNREIEKLISSSNIKPLQLTENEITAIVTFLNALTDTKSLQGRLGIPDKVPSDLEFEK